MPMIDADGCPIYVEVEGREGAPVLMLSNSLGTNLHMWDDQAGEWAKHFRLVRYDRRGHGKSGSPPGPYSMERFGKDVLAVLDALKIKKINWCGLSMGGMVGQWLGANAPDRVEKLILSNTNFYYADKAPVERPHQIRAGKRPWRTGRSQHGALVHQGFPRSRAAGDRAHEGDVPRHQSDGLHRLLRSDPRHGLSRLQSAHHRADPGHRRQAGPGDAAGGRRSHRARQIKGRQARRARCRAYLQHGAAEGSIPRRCSTSC